MTSRWTEYQPYMASTPRDNLRMPSISLKRDGSGPLGHCNQPDSRQLGTLVGASQYDDAPLPPKERIKANTNTLSQPAPNQQPTL